MGSRVGMGLFCGALVSAGFFACHGAAPSSVPLGGVDEPSTSVASPRGGAEKPAKRSPKSAPSDGVSPSTGGEDTSAGGASSTESEGDGPSGESSGVAPKAQLLSRSKGPEVPARTPETCDDSQPAVFDCRPLARRCPPLAPVCPLLENTFKPKVAQALVDCAGARECGPAQFACVRPALYQACVDEEARELCAERLKTCKREYARAEVTQADCEHGLGALLPEVRPRMEACLSESCDVEGCIAELRPTEPDEDEDED